MDTDLAARLDRSIGPAPDGPDAWPACSRRGTARCAGAGSRPARPRPSLLVGRAGRRRARDRRRAGPGRASGGGRPSPAERAATDSPSDWLMDNRPAEYVPATGELRIKSGATVLQRLDNPFEVAPPAKSVALAMDVPRGRGVAGALPGPAQRQRHLRAPRGRGCALRRVGAAAAGGAGDGRGPARRTRRSARGRPGPVRRRHRAARAEGRLGRRRPAGRRRRGSVVRRAGRPDRGGEVVTPEGEGVVRPGPRCSRRADPGDRRADGAVGIGLDDFLAFAREKYAEGGGGLL